MEGYQLYMVVRRPKVKQIRKVMATVYLEYVVMRWKIFLAPMMAETMVERPGLVSTMSAAPRAASVAPACHAQPLRQCCFDSKGVTSGK